MKSRDSRCPRATTTCAAGDLFDVTLAESESPDAASWKARQAGFDRIGAQMAEGRMDVHGPAGDYAGLGMTGGELHIEGDAGRFTGCEMRGGRLNVAGNAGDFAAGALPGDMEGMTGGTLTIHGNAGARLATGCGAASCSVGGDAGDFAASRIVAGTVCIAGRIGAHYAYGMRRGTLLLAREPDRLPPTFTGGGHGFHVFWSLFVRSLAREIAPFSALDAKALPRRHAGDLAVDGRGELLIAQS